MIDIKVKNMKSIKEFEFLAKGKLLNTKVGNTCVIYTRVSTREQAENNMSLDTQRKACELYARKHSYKIMAYFGGTFESAKTDERAEFNHMLSFVRKSREPVSFIIVYSVDRFSRSGANAIYIKEQLKQHGISIISVSQPTDVSTPSGSLQQNIQFIFSEYDNQLRREKTIAGMRDKLLRGEWCGKPPKGYDIIIVNGKHSIKLNKDAEYIRKAFLWKFFERLSQQEIGDRLRAMGFKLSHAYLSNMLRNPFYCGILSNNLLEGKIVLGKHEKLVSQEMFLAINELLNNESNKGQIKHYADNILLPLRRFLVCTKCNKRLTGYMIKKKKLSYYKCKTQGCCVNVNAKTIHQFFVKILNEMKFNSTNKITIKELLTTKVVNVESIKRKSESLYKGNLTSIKNKIEEIEERFAIGKISESLYTKHLSKLHNEAKEVEELIEKAKVGLGTQNFIKEEKDGGILKLAEIWSDGDLQTKRIIQNTIFPQGLLYNKIENSLLVVKLSDGFYLESKVCSNKI